ncbi:Radical SAM domain protein [Fibrobacter succinogenes subsp. succinogenes S85]|uniref:Radical SAM domain protein n=2 Tax=Fibrobacter succinogenes TaxID=833 RepID=A0ABN3YTI5_FIBSS|nr:Radical SAM domain protein [Fibrobacter succinogenes subsp. succinogenes S85]
MRRITLLTNPDACNLHCPLCFLNQRALLNCGESNCNGERPPDNNRGRCAFGMGEMNFEIARAAVEKYAAERDASGKRLLREVIPSTMGEPLLYSHFDELLELCRALGIPLNLTTNGTFPGKWGSEDAMGVLLRSCRDIKVSYLASEQFDGWKANVEKLVRVRDRLRENARCATVSLQVTLHKKNLHEVPEIVSWASAIGIDRIKWNKVVVLSVSSQELREMYALDDAQLESLRNEFRSGVYSALSVKHEGSLFFSDSVDLCAVGGKCESCPFADEVWVWPDGHEDHCPNPERRFGCGKNL